MKSCGKAFLGLLSALLVLACSLAQAQNRELSRDVSANVSAEDLLARPVGANWTSYNGDYTGRRYSSLNEINTAKCLAIARRVGIPSRQFTKGLRQLRWSSMA